MTLSRMVHKQELRSDLLSIWISSAVRCTFLYSLRLRGRVPPRSQHLLLEASDVAVALLQLKSNELFPSRYKSPQRVSVAAQYWPTSSSPFFFFSSSSSFFPCLSTCSINHTPGGMAAFASGCHERSCLLYARQQALQ